MSRLHRIFKNFLEEEVSESDRENEKLIMLMEHAFHAGSMTTLNHSIPMIEHFRNLAPSDSDASVMADVVAKYVEADNMLDAVRQAQRFEAYIHGKQIFSEVVKDAKKYSDENFKSPFKKPDDKKGKEDTNVYNFHTAPHTAH